MPGHILPPGAAALVLLAAALLAPPPGAAREDVFYACTACHSTAVIRRSRLSRQQWDDLMDWMTEKHGMNPLEDERRRQIVDYLATAFPATTGRRRGSNPF